jgi:hypothetical protein
MPGLKRDIYEVKRARGTILRRRPIDGSATARLNALDDQHEAARMPAIAHN